MVYIFKKITLDTLRRKVIQAWDDIGLDQDSAEQVARCD